MSGPLVAWASSNLGRLMGGTDAVDAALVEYMVTLREEEDVKAFVRVKKRAESR